MSFQSKEKKRLAEYALARWGHAGHVLPYRLVKEMLHESFRAETFAYFQRHGIKWWTSRWDVGRPLLEPGDVGLPTGHLNSSQVACVNHLEPARLDVNIARHVIAHVDTSLVKPLPVEDGGYVAYEWIGAENYLGEPGSRLRGSQVTSLDALMLARKADGHGVLIVIEWKYLETYGAESRAYSSRRTDRTAIYRPLLERADCPIRTGDLTRLFYNPYEQLMRQTLLAWQMVEHGEFGATDWIHVHVIPEGNVALRARGGVPAELEGETLAEVWRSVLKEPARYRLVTPTDLIGDIPSGHWCEWREWLHTRYLT